MGLCLIASLISSLIASLVDYRYIRRLIVNNDGCIVVLLGYDQFILRILAVNFL